MKLHLFASGTNVGVEPVIDSLALTNDDAAYVSGSTFDGLGDQESDVDIFVLASPATRARLSTRTSRERHWQQVRRDYNIIYVTHHDREHDVELHPLKKIESLLSELAALDPLSRTAIEESFDSLGPFERSEAVEVLHRLRVGRHVHNPELFGRLKEQFNVRHFFLWNAHHNVIMAEDAVKGTKRSLRMNDIEDAYLKLTRLYDAIADFTIFSHEHSLDRWKWRLKKIKLIDEGLYNEYLAAYREPLNSKDMKQSIEQFLLKADDRIKEEITWLSNQSQ